MVSKTKCCCWREACIKLCKRLCLVPLTCQRDGLLVGSTVSHSWGKSLVNITGWSGSDVTLNFLVETNKINRKVINCCWRGRGFLCKTFYSLWNQVPLSPQMISNDFQKDSALQNLFPIVFTSTFLLFLLFPNLSFPFSWKHFACLS